MIKNLQTISLCALLAACDGHSEVTPPASPTPAPAVQDVVGQVDAALAKTEIATEVLEPESIETVTVLTTEDTEPKSL